MMRRLNIFYCFSIFLIILLVNGSLAALAQKDEAALGSVSKENKASLDGIQDSKVAGWRPGFPWAGPGGFPWVGPGGPHGPGGAFPWFGPGRHRGPWFPRQGGDSNGGGAGGSEGGHGGGPGGGEGGHGGGPGGGEGGHGGYPGGTPGTPGGWFPWGGRGGNGGGSGGSPGGPNCGGNGGGPGGGAGGCGGNGGAGGGSGGGRGGGWVPPHTEVPKPVNAGCGGMQIVPSGNGYIISYTCGNCKYQYTVNNNGMATGGSGSCS